MCLVVCWGCKKDSHQKSLFLVRRKLGCGLHRAVGGMPDGAFADLTTIQPEIYLMLWVLDHHFSFVTGHEGTTLCENTLAAVGVPLGALLSVQLAQLERKAFGQPTVLRALCHLQVYCEFYLQDCCRTMSLVF